ELVGGVCIEDDHVVDHLQRRQHLGAIALPDQRPAGALAEPPRRAIAVETDHQHVTERLGGTQVADVAGMEKVEDAVGEDDAPPGAALRRQAAPQGGEGEELGRCPTYRHRPVPYVGAPWRSTWRRFEPTGRVPARAAPQL